MIHSRLAPRRVSFAMSAVTETFPLGLPWPTLDPFLLCVYHKDAYPKGEENMGPHPSLLRGRNLGMDFTQTENGFRMYHGHEVPGFPSHPHRGFETITLLNSGTCDHFDSLGASARYGNGDLQWMTAGAGIQHSEMFPLLFKDKPNPLELFQIWLNLPSNSKMVNPYFTMIWNENVPKIKLADGQSLLTIVADTANLFSPAKIAPPPDSWASQPTSNVAVVLIDLAPGVSYDIPPTSNDINRRIYFFEGDTVQLNGKKLTSGHGATLKAEAPVTLTNAATGKSRLFLFQGKPIGEPVSQRGPFVMNTPDELRQAYTDYAKTQFGGWPWESSSPVHPRDKGRFAKHPDGRMDLPTDSQ